MVSFLHPTPPHPHRFPLISSFLRLCPPSAREARAGLRGLGAEVRARRHWNRVHGEFSGLRFLSLDAPIGVSPISAPGPRGPSGYPGWRRPLGPARPCRPGWGGLWGAGPPASPLSGLAPALVATSAEPQPTARPGPQASLAAPGAVDCGETRAPPAPGGGLFEP